MCTLLQELQEKNVPAVAVKGEGDIADVCRLTCMEQHFTLTENTASPALVVDGLEVRLAFSEKLNT